MSNYENDKLIESLQERMGEISGHLTPATIEEFEDYVTQGELEEAMYLVKLLEEKYADDQI